MKNLKLAFVLLAYSAGAQALSMGGYKVNLDPRKPPVEGPKGTPKLPPAVPSSTPTPTGNPAQDLKNLGKAVKQEGEKKLEGARQVGRDINNGVDHFFKEVDHWAKKNADKLAVVGRAKACTQSFCYSEIYRDQQLKKARADAQAKKDKLLREARAKAEQDGRDGNLDSLRSLRKTMVEHLTEAKALSVSYESDIQSLRGLQAKLETEAECRQTLLAMGGQIIAPTASVADLVERMSQLLRQPNVEAMAQLEADIEARAAQLGIDFQAMNNEITKAISGDDLSVMIGQVNNGLVERVQLQANVEADIIETQSQIKVIDESIKKLEPKGA